MWLLLTRAIAAAAAVAIGNRITSWLHPALIHHSIALPTKRCYDTLSPLT